MAGAFLTLFAALALIFLVIALLSDDGDCAGTMFWISLTVTLMLMVGIPISRLDTKSKVLEIEAFQETLNNSRAQEKEFDVLERAQVIKEINTYNRTISEWKAKGDKWYHNKWYYHPSTQNVKFIK